MTEIFGTLGPSCVLQEIQEEMLRQGMTGVRLNLSHTSLEESRGKIENYTRACEAIGVPKELIIDLHGPEMRSGFIKKDLHLWPGDEFILRAKRKKDELPVYCVPPAVLAVLEPGDRIILQDGQIQFEVEEELEEVEREPEVMPDSTEAVAEIQDGLDQEAILQPQDHAQSDDDLKDTSDALNSDDENGTNALEGAVETPDGGKDETEDDLSWMDIEIAREQKEEGEHSEDDTPEDPDDVEEGPATNTGRYKRFRCVTIQGGIARSQQTVRVVGKEIFGRLLTRADHENLDLAAEMGVTAVMQPFVRDGADIEAVRAALVEHGLNLKIYAKVESEAGLRNIDSIIEAADVVVIARGDLGNAIPLWELPGVQKQIAERCKKAGKPFMVVTQMLQSMMQKPVPTRAEVTDIFNAVLDGADSVMVTGETSVGRFPWQVIQYLTRTVRAAEAYLQGEGYKIGPVEQETQSEESDVE